MIPYSPYAISLSLSLHEAFLRREAFSAILTSFPQIPCSNERRDVRIGWVLSVLGPILHSNIYSSLTSAVHADSQASNIIPAFRQIWFGLILRDPASFFQQLSTTIMHQRLFHGAGDESKVLTYQQMALQSVNERLSDPVFGLSDGIVGTVVSFLTNDVTSLSK